MPRRVVEGYPRGGLRAPKAPKAPDLLAGWPVVEMAVDALRPAPYNPRVPVPEQMEALERSFDEFGMLEFLVVNKRTRNTVVGGNMRLKLLRKRKVARTRVVLVDWPLAKEKAANLALNRIEVGEWDYGKVGLTLEGMDEKLRAATGFTDAEVSDMSKDLGNWKPREVSLDDLPPLPLLRCPKCGHRAPESDFPIAAEEE